MIDQLQFVCDVLQSERRVRYKIDSHSISRDRSEDISPAFYWTRVSKQREREKKKIS